MIEVEGPDGAVIEFPDGTLPAVMQKAMAAHYAPIPDVARSFGSTAKRGIVGIPGLAGDTINLLGGIKDKLGLPSFDMRTGKAIPAQVGTDYSGGLPTGGSVNAALDKATGSEPYKPRTPYGQRAATLGSVAGTMLAPGGVPERLARMLSAGLGSEAGGELARNYAPDWEQEARVLGAIGGGVTGEMTAVPGVKALAGGSGSALNVDPLAAAWDVASGVEAAPNAMGMSGGNLRSVPKVPKTEQNMNSALIRVDKNLAKDAGYLGPNGLQKFDEWLKPYEEQGVAPLGFQAYQQPGVSKAASIVRQPGETAQRAFDTLEGQPPGSPGKRYELQTRTLGALDKMTGGPKALETQIRAAQKDYGKILTDDAVKPELQTRMAALEDRIDDADLKDIVGEAAKTAKAWGYSGTLNQAQMYQFIKGALWKQAEQLEAHGKTRGAAYKDIFFQMQQALHDDAIGIPGYKEADSYYSALMSKSALDKELRTRISSMSDWANPSTVAQNPAKRAELEAAFGKDASDEFTKNQYLVRRDAAEYQRVMPGTGSPTAQHLAGMADTAAEFARNSVRKGPGEAIMGGLGWLGDRATLGFAQRGRDALGDDLMHVWDDPSIPAAFREKLSVFQQQARAAQLARALTASQATGANQPPLGKSQVEQYWKSRGGAPAWYGPKDRE